MCATTYHGLCRGRVKDYRSLTDTYRLSLVAYEGGQHVVGSGGPQHNEALKDLFRAFNRDPRIKQLYLDYLGLWKQAGDNCSFTILM